jgi:hypothetical protein
MEMTWMETIQLLGLDLLVLMLLAVLVLDVVEQSVRSAWVTARSRKLRLPKAAATPCVNIGSIKHV